MSAKFRFDIDALRGLVAGKTFAKGEDYYDDGLVEILSVQPARVLATVSGTEDYRTELIGAGRKIGGSCSCPAFEDSGFCKHMVAVALAANALGADAEAEGAGVLSRIRRHLKEKGVDALVAMIVDLAERDPALFRRLDMAATAMHADDKTLEKRLRKAIDSATEVNGYVGYREASAWVAEVDTALDAFADLAAGPRAGVALTLAERAIDNITAAIEEIDDSNGEVSGLLERARDIHLAAARSAPPEAVAFARGLFAREVKDDYGTFHGAVQLYADVLGAEGLAEYRRLAQGAWDRLPAVSGEEPAPDSDLEDSPGGYYQLRSILDFFLERDGDVDARIALRAKGLSSSSSYLQLAEFCSAQGRKTEALRWAEEGMWMFEDGRPDEPLVMLGVELLSKAGRKADAEAHLRRAFEKQPSLDLYTGLGKVGGKSARERAVKFLEDRLAGEKPTQWSHPADLLVDVLMHDKMFEAAWAIVRKHGASVGVKETLARASEATHAREAIAVYTERIDRRVADANNLAYEEAASLVARMARLRGAEEQAAYVADLKERFRAKRNFMKLLG